MASGQPSEALVTFDYEATQDDELTLRVGQIISNITMMEEGWWEGEVDGRRGLFPDNFVEAIKKEKPGPVKGKAPSPPPPAVNVNGDTQEVIRREGSETRKKFRAKVVYSYQSQNEDEIGLAVDDVIDVTGQPEDGWFEGVLNGKRGMFPSNFVAVLEGDDGHLGSGDKTDGAKEELPPLPLEPPKPKPAKVKGVGFGNIFAGGEVKLRKTGMSSGADNSKKDPRQSTGQSELAQKRLSLKRPESVPSPKPAVNTEAKPREETKKEIKPEIKKEEKKDVKPDEDGEYEEIVRKRARVTFPYEAQHADELELKEGDIVTVLDKEAGDSGWWMGEIDGRKGVFPDNFVAMLPPEKERVKKKAPAPVPTPARPTTGPKLPEPIKPAATKPILAKPPPPPQDSATVPNTQPRRPMSHLDAVTNNAQPKEDAPPAPKPHPIAAPKPPKKVLPIPPKKPPIRAKVLPPKPSAPPPEEPPPQVVLRQRPADKQLRPGSNRNSSEGGFEDLRPESGQKLTHITLSRPKNTNKRPPSVFGGQGGLLSEARLSALLHEQSVDVPKNIIATSTVAPTTPTSTANTSQPPWVRELKSRSLKRPPSVAKESQVIENGPAVAPPRPKSSPIGPSPGTSVLPPATAAIGKKEPTPTPSPATSRPASVATSRPVSLATDSASVSSQIEDLKKEMKALQDQMATVKSDCKKNIMNLTNELDEEKKLRVAMQVELDRIKKPVFDK